MGRDKIVSKSELTGNDYRLFQSTPAWELAKAVWDENEVKIKGILTQNPQLINYQEPKYGSTLLMLTIKNQQYKPFKILLGQKADISIHDSYDGTSALIEACSSTFGNYDIKFAEDLIKNGANVNDFEVGDRRVGNTTRFTPLMAASKAGRLDIVNLLVINHADLNYQNEYNQSALSEAVILQRYKVILFLLNKGIDYNLPTTYIQEQNRFYHLVDELRFYMPELYSDDYKHKMEIISFLRSKGIEYKDVPIPEYVISKAKKDYPNSWQEYLEKY